MFVSAPYTNFDIAPSSPERIRTANPPRALRLASKTCCALIWISLVVGCGTSNSISNPPKRVVLITVDTLRADHLGCYGATRAHTPVLDAIAASGVRFAVVISPTPVTLPSHASLMTALDPPRHGVRHNSIYALDDGIPTLAEQMRAAGFATAAFVGASVLDKRFGLARGFEHYDDRVSGARRSGAVGYAERRAGEVVDAALAWLDQAPQRFFLWLHLYDPHAAHDPPVGFASAFASRLYAGEIAYVDAQIGRLIQGVHSRFGSADLLLAVTSDHGESLGEHGEITHSYTVYDATQRIPLLMAGSGLPEHRVVAGVARLIDVGPTLLALSGAPKLPAAAGIDLLPMIDGSEQSTRVAYVETLATQLDHGWSPLLGIRSDRFKFIRAPRPELYDLRNDPGELRDRAAAEPETVAQLDRQLSALSGSAARSSALPPLPKTERRRLESLGYVVPGAPPLDDPQFGVVGGRDPKDEIGVLQVIAKAHSALSNGRSAEALALLAAQGDRGHVVASMRAAAALGVGEFELAQAEARSVLAQQPNRPDLWTLLGRAREGQGDADGAHNAFRESIELDASSSEAHVGLGRALTQLGRSEEAIAAFESARGLNPRDPEPIWRLAVLLLESGRAAQAAEPLAALPPDVVNRPSIAIRLARADQAAGRIDRALARIHDASIAHPANERLVREQRRMMAQESDGGRR